MHCRALIGWQRINDSTTKTEKYNGAFHIFPWTMSHFHLCVRMTLIVTFQQTQAYQFRVLLVVKTQARSGYTVPNHTVLYCTVLYIQIKFGRNESLEYLQDTTMNLIRYKEISFRVLTQWQASICAVLWCVPFCKRLHSSVPHCSISTVVRLS